MPNIEVEPLTQIGPYGCVPACLANVGRHLLNEDVRPKDIDEELHRQTDKDFLPYDRLSWLLRRGLTVGSYVTSTPDALLCYFRDEKTYDELLPEYAVSFFGGNLLRAQEEFYSEDYRDYVERMKARYPLHLEELEDFAQVGKYFEIHRPLNSSDVRRALVAGKVVLASNGVNGLDGHQELLWQADPVGDSANVYSPGELISIIQTLETDKLVPAYLYPEDALIVSA